MSLPYFLVDSSATLRVTMALPLAAIMVLGITLETARAQDTATYTLKFQGNWNAQSTTTGAPGGAHFTTFIGAVHNGNVTFWEPGGMATSGVENVAELGSTSTFNSELMAAGQNVKEIISFSSPGPQSTKTRTIEFSKSHPLFTFLSMLGPSPDWFIGLSDFSLLDGNGNWHSSRTVDLFAYDAGTEEGSGWSLNNPDTNPQEPISSLKGMERFTNVRVARMTFELSTPPDTVSLSISGSGAVTEGNNASFTISANPAPSSNLTVNLTVSENSSGGRDFVKSDNQGPQTVQIDADSTSATYTVATVNDNTDEPNGSVTVTIASGNGYTVGSRNRHTLTITDDDATKVTLSAAGGDIPEIGGTKTITVKLNRMLVAGELLTVPLTFGGTAQRNTDYMLTGASTPGVTYNNLNSGSANIVFGSGGQTATLTLTARDDPVDEGTGERVTVALGAPTQFPAGGATQSGTASFTITDNDTGAIAGVMVSKGRLNLTEGKGVETYTVVLTKAPVSTVTVTATSSAPDVARVHTGSGSPASDVTLTFTSGTWNRPQTVTVTPQQDANTTQDTATITHMVRGGGSDYATVTANSVIVTVADDDVVDNDGSGNVGDGNDGSESADTEVTARRLSVNEGGTGTYTVVLTEQPSTLVTVTPIIADPGAVSVYPASLAFRPGNWNVPQSVTVTGVADADGEDETVDITHKVTSTDTRFARLTIPLVTIMVVDGTGPAFVTTQFAFTLAKNLVGPAPVRNAGGDLGAVRATGAGVTYALAAGSEGLFQIDAITGVVTYIGPGATTGSYTLTVRATDARGRNATTSVTVDVLDPAAVTRLNRVHRTMLPEAARLAAGSAFAAVSGRLSTARTARLQVAGYEVQAAAAAADGAQLLAGMLGAATGRSTPDRTPVLSGSEFVLPLSASGDTAGRAPVLWGSVDWIALSGSGTAPDWDGGMLNAHLGADIRLGERLLGGLALSHARGTFDWTDQGGSQSVTGNYQSRMTSLMPYLGWTAHERLTGWAAATLGRGEVKLDDAEAGQYDSEANAWSAGAGVRGTLLATGQMALALKGEGWLTQWAADAMGPLASLNVAAQRLRLALEGSQTWDFDSGAALAPSLEIGVRHDGGDGETGTGLELGGGVRWTHPAQGLTMQARARTLLGRGGYRQWGVAGLVRIDPGADGQGLALSVAPAWGVATSGVARLWNEGVAGPATPTSPRYEPRLEGALGYGVTAPDSLGTATPYVGLSLTGARAVTWRSGLRLAGGAGFDTRLETTWREPIGGAADHGVTLEVRRRF